MHLGDDLHDTYDDADLNIATRASPPAPETSWSSTILICSALLFAVVVGVWTNALYFTMVLLIVVPMAAWIAWNYFVREGVLTWLRLAFKPAKLFAKGDPVAAEAALELALLRARRFGQTDPRRARMLILLATYLGNQGRPTEATRLYEEAAAILEARADARPWDYFVSLNNHAVIHIDLKNWHVGREMLEKLQDVTLDVKKQASEEPNRFAATDTRAVDFMIHVNLARIYLDLEQNAEAGRQLASAESLLEVLNKKDQAVMHDTLLCMRGECELLAGREEACRRILDQAQDSMSPSCIRLRARLFLRAGNWSACAQELAQFQHAQRKVMASRHPIFADVLLDEAECAYNLGDGDKGFALLGDARGLASVFEMPRPAAWRRSLAPWIERATQSGRSDLARELATEAQPDPVEATSIMELESFRRRRENEAL